MQDGAERAFLTTEEFAEGHNLEVSSVRRVLRQTERWATYGIDHAQKIGHKWEIWETSKKESVLAPLPSDHPLVLAHWRDLALLAEEMAPGLRIPSPDDERLLEVAPSLTEETDGVTAVLCLTPRTMYVGVTVARKGADWRLRPYLMSHLGAENPQWQKGAEGLKQRAVNYWRAVCALFQELVQQAGEKTGLAYNPDIDYKDMGFGFSRAFFTTLLGEAMRAQAGTQYRQDGLNLYFGGLRIAVAAEGQGDRLAKAQESHKTLIGKVKNMPRFKLALEAREAAETALAPLRDRLELLALKKTFQGRCPVCP